MPKSIIFVLTALTLISSRNPTFAQQVPVSERIRHIASQTRETTVYPNIRIHPNSSMQQVETSIATHPSDPNTVLAVAIASSRIAPVVTTGWHYTTDGGQTWIGRDTLPTFSNLNLNMVDPAVGIDADGSMYSVGLYGVLGSVFDIYVARSTDNGTNWAQTIITSPINAERTHLAIDVNPTSPYKNYLYLAYSENSVSGTPIMFVRSTDRGQSFSTPVTISGSIGSVRSTAVNLAVGSDSILYATWSGFDGPWPGPIRLGFNRTTDGGLSWGTAASIRSLSGIGPYLNKGGNSVAVWSVPSMAVDRSTSPRRGWIYSVYADKNPTTPDVFLIRSTNGGSTWSSPKTVNQDTSGNDQWNPWISVDPSTGYLFVVYYDSRNFPANDSAQVYISASTDGGETFEDFLVSDAPFLPAQPTAVIPPPPGYMGGYIGIAALQGVVWPCWNDNRTGIHQIYTCRFVFPLLQAAGDVSPRSLSFGAVDSGKTSDTLTVSIKSFGADTLIVSTISRPGRSFNLIDVPYLPLKLAGLQIRDLRVSFVPTVVGLIRDSLVITCNDTTNPTRTVTLSGTGIGTGVREISMNYVPTKFSLEQNFPNPFNPTTAIRFQLPATSFVSLRIYDILGREVSVLVNGRLNAGSYEVKFDPSGLSTGAYFYRLQAGGFVQTRRLILMR